jgi:hypothetical protein
MYQRYVASVSYRCCKGRSESSTCCNGYTRIFQVYVLNVFICITLCYKYFHLDVAKVDLDLHLHVCCKLIFSSGFRCFASISSECCICLQLLSSVFPCIFGVFRTHVSDVYLFSLYVVTLTYGYFKSRSELAHGDACEK